MKKSKSCPCCSCKRVYSIRRAKSRCAVCKYEWTPNRFPLRLDREQWKRIVKWFLHGLSAQAIGLETGINRWRIHRALLKLRAVMAVDVPDVFSGTVEVDETYIGARWKNRRKKERIYRGKRGRGTIKTPVFGILCRSGKVWAEVVPDIEARTVMAKISRQVKQGSVICSDTLKIYTGIAARGYVHRIVEHNKGEYVASGGNHINGLEGFWGYLKRKLASKGGIRKHRLPLYVAEYVWRYNHRNFTTKKQTTNLLTLLQKT